MNSKSAVKHSAAKKRIGKPAANRKKRAARPKKPINRYNLLTALCLVVFFPIGLMRMWLGKCNWNKAIKYGVSGLCAALSLAIIFAPSPYHRSRGGIEIVAEDPEVEIYGPAAPHTMINGYTSAKQESVVIDSVAASSNNVTVFAAEGAKCYHLGDCKFAFASAKRLTVYEAYFLHYKPCGACEPPVYDPVTGMITKSTKAETADESVTTEDQASALANTDPAAGIEYGDYNDGSSDDIV